MRRLGLFIALIALIAAAPPPELGRAGMVAADHRLASEAGAELLKDGGNAVDAAIAAALASGVVQPSASGLGGGGFAVVVAPEGTPYMLDFREVAPAAASRDMFLAAAPGASREGGLAAAVPGEPAGLVTLHRRYGARPLKAVAAPAIRLAKRGFSVGAHLADSLARTGEGADALARGLFGAPRPPRRGEQVRRERLAKTLQAWARTAGRDLTHGWAAADVVQAARDAGGVLTAADLAAYAPRERTPLIGKYRGWTVITAAPPSSGGAVLLQCLAVLEGYDLPALGHNSAAYLHLLVEGFQHAYADRARYMGDPDRVTVPVDRLLSLERIAAIRAAFDPQQTLPAERYGTPLDPGTDGGTLHISAMDASGTAVALTTTINTSFGSRVIGPRSGILLNNEMDDFVARPGEPNAFGLIGGEANVVAPGARPLSSMTPTILISPDGKRRIAVGGSGGPFIISSTLQVIANLVDFGMDPAEAVAAPRVHHQWQPRRLMADEGLSADTLGALRARGHEVDQFPFFSAVQVVVTGDDGLLGASDPRKGGWPAGAER